MSVEKTTETARSPEEVKMRRALRVLDAWKLATGHPGMAPDLCAELCKAMEAAEAEVSRSAESHGREEAAQRWREAVRAFFEEVGGCEDCGMLPWNERHDGAPCKACDPLRALFSGNAAPQATPSSHDRLQPTAADTIGMLATQARRREPQTGFPQATPSSPPVVQENQERAAAPRSHTDTEEGT